GQPDGAQVFVDADPAIATLVASEHQGAIDFAATPVGTTDFEMSTYFADVGDVGAIQIVNEAQTAYATAYIAMNLPQYASLPVLSVSAPFRSGAQGGADYTTVPAGVLTLVDAAELYPSATTLHAVKLTGAELLDWLETAATRFAQIDPNNPAPQ